MGSIDWSELFKHRQSISKRYPTIWTLPIRPRYSNVLLSTNISPVTMLEVGAGDRSLKEKINKRWNNCKYFSFDIDKNRDHDFYSLESVQGEYDLVCMFEMIEHITPDIALEVLQKCFSVMKPGASLMITTPNTFYPPAYLRDATHITPWCYDELGGIVRLAGFEINQIFRLYKESILKQLFRRYIGYPLFRLVQIDYAKQIMLVASKPLS
ncbi:MAG: methyltransferase domain-containing protein [Pseudomonadales bacterium]|nr:methyltransferase domain-containing protein [Pseudomonadales bacterium]